MLDAFSQILTEPRSRRRALSHRGYADRRNLLLLDDGEDVAGGQEQVLLAVVLDLGAAVLAEDDDVALGDIERDAVAVVVDATGAGRDDLALLRLLLGSVGDDQARGGGGLGLEGLDEDAVLERLDGDRHFGSPFFSNSCCG